jgi:hypothetical protein
MRLVRVLLTTTLAACGAAADGALATETDSAGVRIVTSGAPAEEWVLADAPELALGEAPGDTTSEFFRVVAIALLPDGRTAIGNGGTQTIRFFDRAGALVGEVGGRGAGPDEFNGLTWIGVRGDSLLAYDGGNDRVTVRELSGRLVRGFRLNPPSGRPQPAALVPDGSLLTLTVRGLAEMASEGVPRGTVLDSALISRYDLSGELVDSVGRFPHNQRFVQSDGYYNSVRLMPYTTFGRVVGAPDGFCYVAGSADQVSCFRLDGTPSLASRTGAAPRPVTAADVEAHWAREIAAAGADEGKVTALAQLRRPADQRTEWRVFDDGRWVGRLYADSMFDIRAASADRVAGVRRDELDVESVRLYRYAPEPR